MADKQLYQLTDNPTPNLADVMVMQAADGSSDAKKVTLTVLRDLLSKQEVTTPVLEGTDDNTTAELDYGINVIETATDADFCARLPLVPQKGRSVTIVNVSDHIAKVYPSIPGGDINGVVDGFIEIAPNALPVTIHCYENPLPGSWGSIQAPSASRKLIILDEISIAHVNGAQQLYVGIGKDNTYFGASGAGTNASTNLVLTPDTGGTSKFWRTERGIAKMVSLKVFSNIKNVDLTGSGSGNYVQLYPIFAQKTGLNATTVGQWAGAAYFTALGPSTGSTISGGVIGAGGVANSDAGIVESGDAATQWLLMDTTAQGGFNIGEGQYSNTFYTIGITVPSSAATKTYKFRVEIEYL